MLKSKLTAAVLAALAFGYASATLAATDASTPVSSSPQDTSASSQSGAQDNDAAKKAKKLDAVTVTGSLIPQSQVETAQPVITITAEDMKARGFTTVAEALQQSSFAIGSAQGPQDNNSFTTGAKTLSLFGLPVGFTKYLIDGRPMGDFPGLYNGSDVFNNLSNIPQEMVDHIDILPGGQSSLYGSDAIAGVVNIVLKKKVDAPSVDVRFGGLSEGGGASQRISFADSFSVGKFNTLIGAQYEQTKPIWGYSRDLTKTYFNGGSTPGVASRDYLVTGYFSGYQFEDPNNCANVSSGYNGDEQLRNRPGHGTYCGSLASAGYSTLANQDTTANLYSHSTFDVNDNLQLYGDLLYNYEEQKYTSGSNTTFWSSGIATAGGKPYFYDPNTGDFETVQRIFTPEEVGGYQNIMNKQYENSYLLTLGGKGTIGQSNWDYDLGFSHSDDKLINRDFQRFTAPIEKYFADHVMGQQLPGGTYSGYPQFSPNYANLYHPVSTADFRSFTGYTTSTAKTWDNMTRGQLTNQSLFQLAGGDAGIAVVLEGGNQGWDSSPDPRLLQTYVDQYGNTQSVVYGTSATPGAGHRSRYAATSELRLPLLEQLTMDISGRYDSYNVGGTTVSHPTFNVGLEYRPIDTLLLRGRYGSAFKAPTLADEFQRPSGYYNSVTDYVNCARLGYGPDVAATKCPYPYDSTQYQGTTYGNPDLKPITANVWTYGFVWAPLEHMSFAVDYLHWDINNEVSQISADQLSRTEYLCQTGGLDPQSGSCVAAFNLITRGPGTTAPDGTPLLGQITNITTPKLNIANEQVNAITANFGYLHTIGYLGSLALNLSYSDELKHTTQDYITDPKIDVLRHPGAYPNGTDFKSKANGSLTWTNTGNDWSATAYFNRYGSTPNYAATVADNYTDPGTGKLAPWIVWNASVTYNPIKSLALSLLVNNVFNKMPPTDNTYPNTTNSPYNTDNYNVYGRAYYFEAKYSFGGTAK